MNCLLDPTIESVEVEDPLAGSFDDVVIRYTTGIVRYEQAKCSNRADVALGEASLLASRTAGGQSALRRFFDTWHAHRSDLARFAIVTNRSLDHTDPIVSTRDNQTGFLDSARLRSAGPRSHIGKALRRWASNADATPTDMSDFLSDIRIESLATDHVDHVLLLQRQAGLRSDPDSLQIGLAMIRGWVTTGHGRQTRSQIKVAIRDAGLLSSNGVLRLDVYAIDKRAGLVPPNVQVDLRHLYQGTEPRDRRELKEPGWRDAVVLPHLRQSVDELDEYGVRNVIVGGSMRLPYWFTLGWLLPETRNWRLSSEQGSEVWEIQRVTPIDPVVLADESVAGQPTLVAICLTWDATVAVRNHARLIGVDSILVLGGNEGVGPASVPSADWVSGWAQGVKSVLMEKVSTSPLVHLIMACPQSVALALGHVWNLLPHVVTYEWIPERGTYVEDLRV